MFSFLYHDLKKRKIASICSTDTLSCLQALDWHQVWRVEPKHLQASAIFQSRPALSWDASLVYSAGNPHIEASLQLSCLPPSCTSAFLGCKTSLNGWCRHVKARRPYCPSLLTDPQSALTSRDTESWVTAVQVHTLRNTDGGWPLPFWWQHLWEIIANSQLSFKPDLL